MILDQIIILMLLIGVGFTAKRLGIVTNDIHKEVSSLVINITLPAYIITAMNQSFDRQILIDSGMLILISFAVYGASILMAPWVSRALGAKGSTKDIFEYVMIFPNVGYMGYPVLDVAFGQKGVFYGAVFNLAFNLLVWSYGVWLLSRHATVKDQKKGSWLNPALIAVVVGFAMFYFSVQLPTPIFKTMQLVGGISTPLSMMFIGFILSDVAVRELLHQWQSIVLSVIRLGVIPLVLLAVLRACNISGLVLGVSVLLMGMPAAANTAILAHRYNSDELLASKVIFVSTLISIGTIPILLSMIQ